MAAVTARPRPIHLLVATLLVFAGCSTDPGGEGAGGTKADASAGTADLPPTDSGAEAAPDGGGGVVVAECEMASDCLANRGEPGDCRRWTCEHGSCGHEAADEGASCEDGNACTGLGTCQGGKCDGGEIVKCDDEDPCTVDRCDPESGCSHDPEGTDGEPCDDGDACTDGEACEGGSCKAGAAKSCDDEDPCTADSCDPSTGSCRHDAAAGSGASCDDGDPCTNGDFCNVGVCAGEPKGCDDLNPCTVGTCLSADGSCYFEPRADGELCDDEDPCTEADACAEGLCEGTDKDCGDGEPCTPDHCHPKTGECLHDAPWSDNTPCEDGDACTTGETCQGGSCEGERVDCNDKDPCTTDSCDPLSGRCEHEGSGTDGLFCDDGEPCTEGDVCVGGKCTGGSETVCDDGNMCSVDFCSPGTGCVYDEVAANRRPCEDGRLCTIEDACQAGKCQGNERDCDDLNPCTLDACVPSNGTCTHHSTALEGQPCNDLDPATEGDVCRAGVCRGTEVACDDGNPCTVDSTDPDTGRCTHDAAAREGHGCDDGSFCTIGDRCEAGECTGDARDCDDGYPCTADSCDPSTNQCAYVVDAADGELCDDGDLCTLASTCSGGRCEGIPRDCSSSDPCVVGYCDEEGECAGDTEARHGEACDDGRYCTLSDTCQGGVCTGPGRECDDGDPCTLDGCEDGVGCTTIGFAGGETGCDDGDPCTLEDSCNQGACEGEPKDCDDGDQCTLDVCSGEGGDCLHDAAALNGQSCSDGDSCTIFDHCDEGSCVAELDCSRPMCREHPGCPDGDSCDGAIALPAAVPSGISATTEESSDSVFAPAGVCADAPGYDLGASAPDHVYTFAAPASGPYTFGLDTLGGFEAAIYVVSDCDQVASTCLGAAHATSPSPFELGLELTQGETYTVIVDGAKLGAAGGYGLSVTEGLPCVPSCGPRACGDDGCGGSCGTCAAPTYCDEGQCLTPPMGDACGVPLQAMEAPLANHGDNTSAADRHHAAIGACPGGGSRELGLGGSDQAWSFESTADGVHRVVVTPEGDFDPALYVVSDCNDLAGSCLGGVDTVGVGPEELEVELAVGDEIRIIVDGCCIEEPGFGAYKLEVHRPCQPDCSQKECGDDGCGGVCDTCPVGKRCSDTFTCEDTAPGETCASPFVAAIPWTSTSSTAAASDDHEAAAGACPGVGWPMGDGAPDHVYRVKANATDLHTFTLEPEPGFDGALYVLDACGEQSTCLGGADLNGDGEKERLSLSLEAGDEVLVVVDGGSGEEIEAGGYTLRLSVGLP